MTFQRCRFRNAKCIVSVGFSPWIVLFFFILASTAVIRLSKPAFIEKGHTPLAENSLGHPFGVHIFCHGVCSFFYFFSGDSDCLSIYSISKPLVFLLFFSFFSIFIASAFAVLAKLSCEHGTAHYLNNQCTNSMGQMDLFVFYFQLILVNISNYSLEEHETVQFVLYIKHPETADTYDIDAHRKINASTI